MAIMADKVPFPYMSSTDMLEYMIERMMYRFHGTGKKPDDPLDKKIEAAYKERFGCEMLIGQEVENVCLHGMPGVGKTSVVRAAAKEVAKMLGMNFVSNPVPPYRPQENDLVISTLEMSGEVSNIVMGGIPVSDQLKPNDDVGDPLRYMNKLPLYQLAIMRECRAPILLLDDFANAAPPVQNSALSIALEGRFQMLDLGDPFVAMTANLGSLDNSDTSPLSDPMMGRIGHFYVEDEVGNFIERTRAKYQDSISDANVIGFLTINPDKFMLSVDDDARSATNGVRTPYPSPRTWDKLINEMRIHLNRVTNGKVGGDGDGVSIKAINDLSSAFIGKKVGSDFGAYVYEVLSGAELIAKELITKDKFNAELFEQKYGKGINDIQQRFGTQLAFSLSSHAAAEIKRNPGNIEEISLRFGKGVMRLDDPTIVMAATDLASRVSYSGITELTEKGISGKPMLSEHGFKNLLLPIVQAGNLVGNPSDKAFSQSLAEAISGVSVYRSTYRSGKSQTPG